MGLDAPANNSDLQPGYIVYGPLGSGVSTVLKAFRQENFVTIHGAPPGSILSLLQACGAQPQPVAICPALDPNDILPGDAVELFKTLQSHYPAIKLLYLSTSTDLLIQRFAQAEKSHLYDSRGIKEAVEAEQAIYHALKPLADYHIDTGTTTPAEAAGKIAKLLGKALVLQPMTVNLVSFGFKNGVPTDAEMVFDMRVLPNPFYDEALRPMTGLDQPVVDYLFQQPKTQDFLTHWQALLTAALPMYQEQGKTRVTIAVGCTGGQHRSVAMLMALAQYMQNTFPAYQFNIIHREASHWPKPQPVAAG